MTRKALRTALLVGVGLLIVLSAGVAMAARTPRSIPEYLGSKACLGCHGDKYATWSPSGHANMINPINSPGDLPADISLATPELQSELRQALYVVAGQRFLARDAATGNLKFANVQWSAADNRYIAYKGGSEWFGNCAGCHAVNVSKPAKTFTEFGIGCEACHGPGRDHALGKGDPSKIMVSTASDVCGQCHNGGAMTDGTRWPVGYRPNMKLTDVPGFKLTAVDPTGAVPDSALHLRQFALMAGTGHANAMKGIIAEQAYAGPACYGCHTADAIAAKAEGRTFDPSKVDVTRLQGITCVACHDPHGSEYAAQLRMEPEALCVSCHSNQAVKPGTPAKAGSTVYESNDATLKGYGAIGIKETPSFHSVLSCQECHMTEGNHMFKVIQPKDVLDAARKDTCTSCHAHDGDSKEGRQAYLDGWHAAFDTKVTLLQADITAIADTLKADPKALPDDLKAKYDIAKTNLSIIQNDGSRGAHNFEFAMRIFADASKKLTEVKAALPK